MPDNLISSLLQKGAVKEECTWDQFEGLKWANDKIKRNYAEGYENPYLDESTGRGETPELDARGSNAGL